MMRHCSSSYYIAIVHNLFPTILGSAFSCHGATAYIPNSVLSARDVGYLYTSMPPGKTGCQTKYTRGTTKEIVLSKKLANARDFVRVSSLFSGLGRGFRPTIQPTVSNPIARRCYYFVFAYLSSVQSKQVR